MLVMREIFFLGTILGALGLSFWVTHYDKVFKSVSMFLRLSYHFDRVIPGIREVVRHNFIIVIKNLY